MSLVAWFPLCEDLHNQGLSDASIVSNNSTLVNTGKIGKAYQFNGSSTEATLDMQSVGSLIPPIRANRYGLDGWSEVSICCWLCPTNANNITTAFAFGKDTYWQLALQNANFTFRDSNTGVSGTRKNISTGTWEAGKWSHLAITYKSGTVNVYRDGIFQATISSGSTGTLNSGINQYKIGRSYNESYWYNGKINDFRIYNHCLSAREVHDIAKGLVCHYKLSEQIVYKNSDKLKYDKTIYIEPDNSMWVRIFHHNNPGATLFSSSSTWANGVYVNEDVWFDIYDTVNSLSSYEFMVKQKLKSTDSEVKYRWIQNKSPLTAVYNDVAPGAVTRITTSGYTNGTFGGLYLKNSNTHMSIANATASNWYGAIGSWTAFNSGIPGYPNTVVTTGYMDLYVRINSDSVPEINDYSGYKHNGVIVGSLSASNDTERYNYSLTFSNSNYAAIGRGGMVVDAITVSWWGKMSNWGSYGRAISCTEGGGWNFEPADSKIRFAINLNGTYVFASDTNTLSSLGSDWHHFVGTYDRTNVKFYRDGELITTTPAPSANVNIKYHASNGIFIGAEAAGSAATGQSPYFPGKLSDIRIYATALSAEDIYELYHTPAYISNLADQFEYELVETAENIFTSENIAKYKTSSGAGTGEFGIRNGENVIQIQPNKFYKNSVYAQVLKDEFKPNTQYVFDMWIDVDDVIYSGSNRNGGFHIFYTDNTSDSTFSFVGGNLGFAHKRFISPVGKSISHIQIVYYTSILVYYRLDSTISEYHKPADVQIKKTGILECSSLKERNERENAAYSKGGDIETREEYEI